jgi:hypothetical protein
MIMQADSLFSSAQLSLAAYANFQEDAYVVALKNAGMTQAQADKFASEYSVVTQIGDTLSGFSATVFKDTNNQLTIAFRGTNDLFDLLDADFSEIVATGAARTQIVEMYNWWQKISHINGSEVSQIAYVNGEIIHTTDTATGEAYSALQADAVVDVTGHSLGGHLAMAFNELFASQSNAATTFNAPGFNYLSDSFFDSMVSGAGVPMNPFTTNVVAVNNGSESDSFSPIAGLWSRPGSPVDIPVEDQTVLGEPNPPAALNHSQMILTDSLAVYNTLAALDSSFTLEKYRTVFDASTNQMYASLESVVDGLLTIFNVSHVPLPAGNNQREALYEAICGLQNNENYSALVGSANIGASLEINAQQASTDFGAFLALYNLSPVYISGAALSEPNSSLYSQWSGGEFSSQYLEDRTEALHVLLGRNTTDLNSTNPSGNETVYFDYATLSDFYADGGTNDGIDSSSKNNFSQVHFGTNFSDVMQGGNKNDHLYGGGGADSLSGGAGDDYLEGGSGDDVLNAGTGFDRLNGGAGNDVYQIDLNNFGDAIISGDTDGGTISLLSGITFRKTGAGDVNADGVYLAVDDQGEWIAGKEGWSVSVSGSAATVIVKDADGKSHTVAIENFSSSNNFGIQLQQAAEIDTPAQSGALTVGNGYLGSYTPSGSETPSDIYLPNNRGAFKDENAAAANAALDIEAYRNKSLTHNAVDYWGEWNANDLQWEPVEDHPGSTGYPGHPNETLVLTTAAARHGIDAMRFEGSNKNDALYSNDWSDQMALAA